MSRPVRIRVHAPVAGLIAQRVARSIVGFGSFRELLAKHIVEPGSTGLHHDRFVIEVPEGAGIGADTPIGPIRLLHIDGQIRVDLPLRWAAKLAGAVAGSDCASLTFAAKPGTGATLDIGFPRPDSTLSLTVV